MADFRELAAKLIDKHGVLVTYTRFIETNDDAAPWEIASQSQESFTAKTVFIEQLSDSKEVNTDTESLGDGIAGMVASKDTTFSLQAGQQVAFGNQYWTIEAVKTTIANNGNVLYKWKAKK